MARWLLHALLFLVCQVSAQPAVYFDDTGASRMLLGNASYEIALSKVNGGILSVLDKPAAVTVTLGSRAGCLWGSLYRFPGSNPDYVGGCTYSANGSSNFTYFWDSASNTLVLKYSRDPSAARGVDATVTIVAGPGAFFDMTLTLQNHWDAAMGQALFPSDLLFSTDSVQAAYLPFRFPGVRLKPAFFKSGMTFTDDYPGGLIFADYLALDSGGGHIAYYGINPSGPIAPVKSGFTHYPGDAANMYVLYHAYETAVPVGGSYVTPTVRFWVGASPRVTILAYRADNAITDYPSIASKLGKQFDQLSRSPMVKLDLVENNQTFQQLSSQVARLPSPLLVHPAAYMPGGHDHSYPDFLPPDQRWGTTADFRAFVDAAHANGLLVMPYTNPTWWKPESPTLMNLPPPLTVADLAVQDQNGSALTETYGTQTGYPVSPWVPFVQQTLTQMMAKWQTDVPVDFVFSDQIGARSWERDYNPSSPTPIGYSDGWFKWWQTYQTQHGMTEDGWDRLAAAGIGFCGSPLTGATSFGFSQQRYGFGDVGNNLLGPGNWDPYPLATWMLHDKVFFYQHDLEETVTTDVDEVVTWDLAFGNMLRYTWQHLGSPRAALGDALQQTVGPHYAGHVLEDFVYITPEVTRSIFGDLSVIANWQQTSPFTIDGYSILPGGYLAQTSTSALLAGAFVGSFNGSNLPAGEHHILIETTATTVSVRQLVGADTDLTVNVPTGWAASDPIGVTAVGSTGASLGAVPYSLKGHTVSFHFAAQAGGAPVDHYEIANHSLAILSAPSIAGIVNAADFNAEPLPPNTWFSIFGQNLGSAGQWANANTFALGGASVSVCGLPAAISYNSGPVTNNGVAAWQLNALIPDGAAGHDSCPVVVTVGEQTSPAVSVSISAGGMMELFAAASSAGSIPVITHRDYTLVGPGSAGMIPAKPGETVTAWGTGDCSTPTLTAGRAAATVTFSGQVGPGLCQLNFVIPAGLTGRNSLSLSTSLNSYALWVTQ